MRWTTLGAYDRIPGGGRHGLQALAICTLLVASAAVAFGPYRANDLPAEQLAPHGSLAMEEQMKRLDELLPARDVTQPPDGIDTEMWALFVPDDNGMSAERVALGRKLYFDFRLSADGTVSCATCHDVSRGFTDQRPTSEGIRDQLGRRNAPTTMNAFFYDTLFLDGRVASLEEQAEFPPINPVEGGHPEREDVLAAIAGDEQYQKDFQAAFGRAPRFDDMVRAIAAFQRTLVFLDLSLIHISEPTRPY